MPKVKCPVCPNVFQAPPSRLQLGAPAPCCSIECGRRYRAQRLAKTGQPDAQNRQTKTLAKLPSEGLLSTFLSVEQARDKTITGILNEINTACGTRYQSNWLSKLAKTGFEARNIEPSVRRYMMRAVLEAEHRAKRLKCADIDKLLNLLT